MSNTDKDPAAVAAEKLIPGEKWHWQADECKSIADIIRSAYAEQQADLERLRKLLHKMLCASLENDTQAVLSMVSAEAAREPWGVTDSNTKGPDDE